MSPSQPLRKVTVAYIKSPDVTVAISSAGNVSVNAATTSPTSLLYVSAAGTFTGICLRKSPGTCACTQVVGVNSGHITASASAYTIKPGAEGSGEMLYKIVPIDGAVLAFGSTGDIRVGTGS
ncbi:MAG TPA: hypothetical protein VGD37_01355 [Kofleriaceae bacterium]|jgi:hypothetical protein